MDSNWYILFDVMHVRLRRIRVSSLSATQVSYHSVRTKARRRQKNPLRVCQKPAQRLYIVHSVCFLLKTETKHLWGLLPDLANANGLTFGVRGGVGRGL